MYEFDDYPPQPRRSRRRQVVVTEMDLARLTRRDQLFVMSAQSQSAAYRHVLSRMGPDYQSFKAEEDRRIEAAEAQRAQRAEQARWARLTPEQRAAEILERRAGKIAKAAEPLAIRSARAFRDQGHTSGQLAVDDSGAVVHVSAVARGLACGLKCPVCSAQVVAKKGEIVTHHFAHVAESACAGLGGEGAVHRWVKQVIFNRFVSSPYSDTLTMPPEDVEHLCGQFSYEPDSENHSVYFRDKHCSGKGFDGRSMAIFALDDPKFEERKAGGAIVSDIGTRGWGSLTGSIEVIVTHAPDAARTAKAIQHQDAIYAIVAGHISAAMTEQEAWEKLAGCMHVIYPGWQDLRELEAHGFLLIEDDPEEIGFDPC